MTFSIAQWDEAKNTNPATTIFGASAGNWFVVCGFERSGNAASTMVVSDNQGNTYTHEVLVDNELADSNRRCSMVVAWAKIETDANVVVSMTSSADAMMIVAEVQSSGAFTPRLLAKDSQGSGTGSLDGVSVSNAVTGSNLAHIAILGARVGSALTAVRVDEYVTGVAEYDIAERLSGTNGRSGAIIVGEAAQSTGTLTATADLYNASDAAQAEGIIAQLIFEDDSGSGGQTITGTGHSDADAFGSGSFAPGAVGISGAGHEDADAFGAGTISASITISGLAFADPDGFGSGSVAPGAAGISGDGHEDADGFGSGSVSAGLAQIFGAGHADPDAFGAGAVASGPIQISGTGFLDGDAFGAGSVVPGPIQISGVGHVDTDGFGSGVVATGEVIGGAGHVDPDTFGSGLVAAGAVTIEGVAYVDPDAFGAGLVGVAGGPQSIGGAGHADPDAFGGGAVVPGPIQIGGAGHAEPDAFGAGRIDIRITGTIYVDADAFGAGQIATGDVIIVGTAFVDPDAFGSGMAGDGTVIAPVDPTRVIRLVREPRASALREARLVALQAESRVLASSRRLP